MAKQTINVGASANDGTGDNLRSAGQKINANFTELYDFNTGIAEIIDDRVSALLVAGANVTLTYNDAAGTLTIDAAGGGGSGSASTTTFTPVGGISATDVQSAIAELDTEKAPTVHTHVASSISDFAEAVDDRLNGVLVAGSGISLTYNDAGNTLTITASGGSSQANLPAQLRDNSFSITTIKAFGDSFSEQPNSHTSGNSMVKKYATLQGVASPTINATSGHSSADGQTAIFTASIAASDHTIHAFGQNDAQFLGTGTDKSLRLADLLRIHTANLAWLGKAAGTNKVAAGSTSSGQRAVAGTWTADADLAGAYKGSSTSEVMQATFTNCRFGVLLYKAKIGSTARFFVKLESDDTNRPVYSAAPESGWVPTNTGQTWAVMARVFDFGAKLPSVALQVGVDASTGGGDVSIVGFVGFSGDVETGPLLGVADVSRRGSAGYATATGSEVNVPIVNRIVAQAMAAAEGFGARVIDLPIASVIDATTGLDTDAFHPSESGATAIAAAWKARVDSGAPLAGRRLDLAVQGVIQNMAGESTAEAPLVRDREGRMRFKRLAGAGLEFTSTDNVVRMSTGGIYLTPVATDGTVDASKALLLLGTGSDCFVQGRIGDLVLGAAASNRFRISGDAFIPETDLTQALGSSSKRFAATWSPLQVVTSQTVGTLPTASSTIRGCRATVTDSTVVASGNFGATVAGGGSNTVPVFCDGANWIIA